ncbi:MAG: potassium/hydrogen antiporter [Actinomycetota bacterium]|nr:potassium/hydrogen antiporter [Actinomycetota bacterium]
MTARLPIPRPAVVFVAAAVVGQLGARIRPTQLDLVEAVVSIALVVILFDGGMQIGVRRFREAAGAIAVVGLVGTFVTTAAVGVLAHVVVGLDWYLAVLVATAVAPTDPAVVFSVLGKRELAGRSRTILEGESGANDPVGIALMVSLLTAGELSGAAAGDVASEFVLQMAIGAATGLLGGLVLRRLLAATRLPARVGALPTVVAALLLFGVAAVAHGSGFLAVFVAGIVVGDGPWPHEQQIRSVHSWLAGLGEVVAFVFLGLTVDLAVLGHTDVWVPGLTLGALLAIVVRPLVVGACLLPVRLPWNERAFVLLAGLKGAVPILLGTFLLAEQVDQAERLYGVVVIVVIFSVAVQGGLVPAAVRRLGLPLHEDGTA